ncbi:hypothetical protein AALP_AA7G032900 [Arabis alpina]|uniref:Uncharacterized protein n=1 Tax=Arabis alpina TaxID=50452 RepID=A0A087GFN1_ARAAL|nr:hypothetical protein AALP_AA7G032900 [Arabis alpina]
MPLPWKKSKSGRISRFVSDFQQSPKHGGSLVVETGFPTSLIDLFVKNRDRLKKQSSKRNKTPPVQTRRRVSPPPSPPPPSVAATLHRGRSLPINLDDPSSVVTDVPVKIEESVLTTEKKHNGDGGDNDGGRNGGGGCVLMVVAFKVFVVAVLALSTKRLAVGITLSAFSLIFLEFAVARVFTLLNLCPHAHVRLGSFIGKLFGKRKQEEVETPERKNRVTFEICEESRDCNEEIQESRIKNQESSLALEIPKPKPVEEEETIRDVVFKKEKSKSAKLKSKIVKKIVPKKLRSYKKKKKSKEEEMEIIEIIGEDEYGGEEEGSSVTEDSSYYSDDRMVESEASERDEASSYQPSLESCCEEIVEEEEEEIGGNGDLKKVMVLIVIVLAGLLHGKVVAIGLTLSSCLILKLVCNN